MQQLHDALPTDLFRTVRRLEDDRDRHLKQIAAIDAVLAEVGRAVARLADGGPPVDPSAAPPTLKLFSGPMSRRGKFAQTGEQSVLALIAREGNPDTARINSHWRAEGRRGSANVLLLRLLKTGVIRREPDASVRGSRYRLASARGEPDTYARGGDVDAEPVEAGDVPN
jgi:hypothetical protein